MIARPLIDIIGAGPQRTGTTWLYRVLEGHPSLCFPAGVKETFFFDRHFQRGTDWYAAYFEHAEEGQLRTEIGPSYFHRAEAARRIAAANPRARIIINLRDPVSRAWSLYQHQSGKGRVQGGFREAVARMPEIMDAGRYSRHVPVWLDLFGRENVHFVVLDDVSKQPDTALDELCAFLGIPAAAVDNAGERVNESVKPRNPGLARLGVGIVRRLHDAGLHNVVNVARRLGARRLIFRSAGDDRISPDDAQWISQQSEPEVEYIERLLNRDLHEWRAAAAGGVR